MIGEASEMSVDKQIEQRAVAHAFGLLAAVGDAKAAKVRLDELVQATKEHDARLAAATAAIAEADTKRATAEAEEAKLTERTAAFQLWVDSTERGYRQREDRIRVNEETAAQRERELASKEADFAQRAAAHEQRLQSLKATLS
jgi:hypothetical protein